MYESDRISSHDKRNFESSASCIKRRVHIESRTAKYVKPELEEENSCMFNKNIKICAITVWLH
jgi:hypothetical protein